MSSRVEYVILVHGTGATAPDHHGDAWWQDGGALWRHFSAAAPADGQRIVEAFIWSGENSEAARRAAGLRLSQRLAAIAGENAVAHLIGHSHGGSVIWHALQALDARPGSVRKAVRSWASVGTPFLKVGYRRPRLWLALCTVVAASVSLGIAFHSLRGVEWAYAWQSDQAGVLWWTALLSFPVLALAWGLRTAWPFLRAGLAQRKPSEALTGPEAATRYLALWSTQDEPIIGLGASGSFSIRVLRDSGQPAANAPRASPFGWIRQPVVTAVNQFVNNMISRAVQGSTVAHLELRATDPYPDERLAHRPLPPDIDRALILNADESAGQLGRRVRELLISGRDPVSGFADLQVAAANTMTFKELVHTSYFDNPACIALLVHHVECHAGHAQARAPAPELPEPLREYYRNRLASTDAAAPRRSLPANRTANATALAALAVIIILSLALFAQDGLHRNALLPTTARHHLAEIAGPGQLATALASAFPAEELEYRLRPASMLENDEGDTPAGPPSDASGNPASQNELRHYLVNILGAGAQFALLASVERLGTEELRSHFYRYAWPLLLQHATDDQLDGILKAGLPGPRAKPTDQGTYFYHPAIETAIFRLAERRKLDQSRIEYWLTFCDSEPLCRERIRLLSAIALTEGDPEADPAWLLPLPDSVQITRIYGKASRSDEIDLTQDAEFEWLLTRRPTGRFLKWAGRHGHWGHAAGFAGSTFRLDWKDYSAALEKALGSSDKKQAEDALRFVTRINWNSPLPESVLAGIRDKAGRSGKKSGAQNRHQRFFDRQRALLECAAWAQTVNLEEIALDNESDRDISKEHRRCPQFRTAADKRSLVRQMKYAVTADKLFGDEGLLAELLQSSRDRPFDPSSAGIWLDILMGGIKKATCAGYKGLYIEPEEPTSEQKRVLAAAFHALGPAPAQLPGAVDAWIKALGDPTGFCPAAGTPSEDDTALMINRSRVFTFYLAQWLHGSHEEQARSLMTFLIDQLAAGTPVSEMIRRDAHFDDLIRWLLSRTYAAHALYAARYVDPARSRLTSRAALFHIAACETGFGNTARASRARELARQFGEAARNFGRPGELIEVIKAEVRYHASRRDWRSARNACVQCDAATRSAFNSMLIPELAAAAANKKPPPQYGCDVLSDEQFDPLLSALGTPGKPHR